MEFWRILVFIVGLPIAAIVCLVVWLIEIVECVSNCFYGWFCMVFGGTPR